MPETAAMRRLAATGFAAAALMLAGCKPIEPWVKPYEREKLADPIMALERDPVSGSYLDHVFESPGKGNLARFTFLDERARDFFSDWPQVADITTANLRRESARDSKDASVEALIDERTAHSPEFTERWGHRDVRRHGFGRKGVRHHLVGELDLDYESFELTSDPG